MAEFKNNWTIGANLILHSAAADPRKLRGGPEMIMPYSLMTFGEAKTDPSKKFIIQLGYSYESSGRSSVRSYELRPGISVRPLSSLKIGITADYARNRDELQYIAMRDLAVPDPVKRYILGTIDQNTLGLTFRVDLNLSPEFSIQYYGSPFVSRGTYSELKRIVDPEAARYEDRFALYDNPVLSGGTYQLYDFDSGIRADYSISDPDFNFYQFRSNLVAKWEYRLGSFIYLVWSGERTGRNGLSDATIGESYKQLFNVFPNNIFLVKLNYWFSL
jgi:hypothetical protein